MPGQKDTIEFYAVVVKLDINLSITNGDTDCVNTVVFDAVEDETFGIWFECGTRRWFDVGF